MLSTYYAAPRVVEGAPSIRITKGLSGARSASGAVVIIDVFRAFSVVPWLFERGARCVIPVSTEAQALELRDLYPDAILAGERDGRKIPGFDLGNSPTGAAGADVKDRIVIHRTGAGTQGLLAAKDCSPILAGSFLTAGATAQYLIDSGAGEITLVAMGWNGVEPSVEDLECAHYLEKLISGGAPGFDEIRARVRDDPTGRRFFDPALPWFTPADFDACMDLDRFAMAILAVPDQDVGMSLVKRPSPSR